MKVKEHPILFSTEMVRAILDGRKTQTRRSVQPQPLRVWGSGVFSLAHPEYVSAHVQLPGQREYVWLRCPYGKPGDRLWVRESHTFADTDWENWVEVHYRDGTISRRAVPLVAAEKVAQWIEDREVDGDGDNWRPSIHMPRWACRVVLDVTRVCIQSLHEITLSDAIAEGFEAGPLDRPASQFVRIWNEINDKRQGCDWGSNPWVWVVEFQKTVWP